MQWLLTAGLPAVRTAAVPQFGSSAGGVSAAMAYGVILRVNQFCPGAAGGLIDTPEGLSHAG